MMMITTTTTVMMMMRRILYILSFYLMAHGSRHLGRCIHQSTPPFLDLTLHATLQHPLLHIGQTRWESGDRQKNNWEKCLKRKDKSKKRRKSLILFEVRGYDTIHVDHTTRALLLFTIKKENISLILLIQRMYRSATVSIVFSTRVQQHS